MSKVYVLERVYDDGSTTILGIFTDMPKAKEAANEYNYYTSPLVWIDGTYDGAHDEEGEYVITDYPLNRLY